MGLGQAEIPLLEGAVMRLGLGSITGNVVFSPDSRYLAVGTSLGVELRDAGTLELIQFLSGHTYWVNSVAFSPAGKTLASGSLDGTVLLWDLTLILQPPTIVALTFPGEVFTSVEAQGTIWFVDPNADLVRAEFAVLEGLLTNLFTLKVDQPGRYRIQVTLVDAAGLRSEPKEFGFEAKTPTAPRIVRVTFPGSVSLNQEQNGIVRFEDPDGDVVRAEFTVVEGDPATIRVLPAFVFDPEVRWMTSGPFRFTVVVTKARTVKLRLVLVDSLGLRSQLHELLFTVE